RALAEVSLLAIVVSLPVAFNPTGVLAFEPLKSSLLRCLALVACVAWLIAHLLGRRRPGLSRYAPNLAAGAVVTLATLSTLFSLDARRSLFGDFQRGMGVLTVVAGAAVFVVATDLWAERDRRERGITAMVIAALLSCAYALVQRSGRDPVPWS